MRGTKKTIYEWFLVVEGSGDVPIDMLRYDACMPHEEKDSHRFERTDERRRLVLVRRSVSETPGNADRWRSFGWRILLATTRADEARELADAPIGVFPQTG